jgi:hypothetical protein
VSRSSVTSCGTSSRLEDARRLAAQSFTLGEFLERRAPGFEPPRLERKALVQAHCHHQAVLDFGADEAVMARLGIGYEIPDSGCCGMAGSFGQFQVAVARLLHFPILLTPSLNSVGAEGGKPVAPQTAGVHQASKDPRPGRSDAARRRLVRTLPLYRGAGRCLR